jgi:predicted TIM-barrel fold metal-dependent hydrolase
MFDFKFIDIHVHVQRTKGFPRPDGSVFALPEDLISRYDELGIFCGVLLPCVCPDCSTHVQSVDDVIEISRKYAPYFVPFCNVDPRQLTNSPDAPFADLLAFFKRQGCKGVGEITSNLPFSAPLVRNLFSACEKTKMPLTFHISPSIGGNYGLYDEPGLPQLEQSLRDFPGMTFLGHSQAFWAEIAPLKNVDDRKGYPKGSVGKPGRVVELMRKYPNLHGDLSAGSGFNAVSRDERFGCEFLDEFQDRLYFGTDICSPAGTSPLAPYLRQLVAQKKIRRACFEKIGRRNAERLLA